MTEINLKDYILVSPTYIENSIEEIHMTDLTIEDDSTFHIVGQDNNLYLTHNCDGHHIKGLLINLFHKYWPELLELGFLKELITPLVKVRKGKEVKSFYSMNDYTLWKQTDTTGWNIKYYKGLGTILADEMKEMFKNLNKHLIQLSWNNDTDSDKTDMLFNVKRVEERKDWLLNYEGEVVPEKTGKPYPISDFYDKEFIQFSMADNIRSIPDIMDGFKPSQRKILYTCLKKNITEEIKVQQLSGAVAETSAYHQGENNLVGTIINMAQDFPGSNNINLLQPKGQFGTRLQGGSDAASGRYIFTLLAKNTKLIFRPEDDAILENQYEEGFKIEPKRYLPIIPMILVNGTKGIGTGWSTDIPKYNPIVLCKILLHKLTGGTKKYRIKPFTKGFIGDIINTEDDKFISNGLYEHNPKYNTVKITELPVNVWTDDYCEFLDSLIDKKLIKDYKNSSTDIAINIIVYLNKEFVKFDEIPNLLKLSNKINLTNMNVFVDNSIKKFDNAESILEYFYEERLKWYGKRKEFQLNIYKEKYNKAVQIYAFINLIYEKKIVPMGMKKIDLINILTEFGFKQINDSYDFLLNMPIHTLTKEKMDELEKEKLQYKDEYKQLQNKTIQDLWVSDIQELLTQLEKTKIII